MKTWRGRRRRPAGLGPRLRVDGRGRRWSPSIGFVRRRALAGLHGEDQALVADRLAHRRPRTHALGGDLVERLQHGDVVAGRGGPARRGFLAAAGGGGAGATSFSEIGGTAIGAGVGTAIGGASSGGAAWAGAAAGRRGVGGARAARLAPARPAAARPRPRPARRRAGRLRRSDADACIGRSALLRASRPRSRRSPLALAAAGERALRPLGVDRAGQVRQVVLFPGLAQEAARRSAARRRCSAASRASRAGPSRPRHSRCRSPSGACGRRSCRSRPWPR